MKIAQKTINLWCKVPNKALLCLIVTLATMSCQGSVEFYSENTVFTNKIKLPDDLAVQIRKDIAKADITYLDAPLLPAVPEFCIKVDEEVYWSFLKDSLFFPKTDRLGHAKIVRVKSMGFLAQRLGGVKRDFYRDKNLEQTVISALRDYYRNERELNL